MMKRMTLFILLALLPLISGCTKHKLSPLNQSSNLIVAYGSVDANFCTSAPSPAVQNLKYIYILDHSSSNQPGFPIFAGDVTSTDTQGSRRYGPLVNFTQNLVTDPTNPTSFALIDFNDIATQMGPVSGFNSDATDFLSIVTKDWIGSGTAASPSPNDHGFTNYQSALLLAEQMIRRDAQLQAASPVQPAVKSNYVIIFVTDGIPVVATGNVVTPTYTQTFAADIGPVIQSIIGLKSDPGVGAWITNISLNTAYYSNGTRIVEAEQLLEQMSIAGNGQYLRFDSGQNILYQQFAPPSRSIRNELADVFVQNENAVWWTDGSLLHDSDADGMPDLIEMKHGSSMQVRDSDGNGVSDLVEYRTKGLPCDGVQCAALQRDAYAICAGFNPKTDASGRVTFSSSTNDGLNDCEKFLLGASRVAFNTNGNLIPDEFAFKSFLPIISGSANSAFSDPFIDGVMNYAKLKLGLPIHVSMKKLNDLELRTTSLTQVGSSDPNEQCYRLQVNRIALTSADNSVKVMVVQNSSVVQDKPFLKVARGSFSDEQLTVALAPGSFK